MENHSKIDTMYLRYKINNVKMFVKANDIDGLSEHLDSMLVYLMKLTNTTTNTSDFTIIDFWKERVWQTIEKYNLLK